MTVNSRTSATKLMLGNSWASCARVTAGGASIRMIPMDTARRFLIMTFFILPRSADRVIALAPVASKQAERNRVGRQSDQGGQHKRSGERGNQDPPLGHQASPERERNDLAQTGVRHPGIVGPSGNFNAEPGGKSIVRDHRPV